MSNNNTFKSTHYLPQMVVAMTFVVILPVVVVWLLLVEDVISSPWVSVGLAMGLSFAAAIAGAAYWKRRSGPGDVLFSEILLWGWLYRLRSERRLASAIGSLEAAGTEASPPGGVPSVERKAQILRQMAVALDAQDPYTEGHSRRVALHAAMIARRMGMSREEIGKIQTAATVHDVGKLRTPVELLNKPSALTLAEFEVVKRHVDDGAEIVAGLEDPELVAMVRHHHERFDGTGYPAALAGEEIPIGARVIAVADTFDALTSERPYRAAIPHKQAMEIIRAASGSQLDPVAVRAFLKSYAGKRAILLLTMLAVSPQRALAMVGGRRVGQVPLGSIATVALPGVLAVVVAVAVGTTSNVSQTSQPARFAAVGATTATAPTAQAGTHHAHARVRSPDHRRSRSALATRAAATTIIAGGINSAGPPGTGNSSSPTSSGGGGSGSTGGTGGSSGGGTTHGSGGSGGHHGGGSHTGVSGKTGTKPTLIQPPGSSGTGAPPNGGSNGPAAPPPPSQPSGSGGGTTGGGTGTGGSTGGNGGGGGTGQGGGNGQGGGTGQGGNGGGGTGLPTSKQDCMHGGWKQFGFSNQGQCIAFVEHTLHSQP